jgi:hypothetical protein
LRPYPKNPNKKEIFANPVSCQSKQQKAKNDAQKATQKTCNKQCQVANQTTAHEKDEKGKKPETDLRKCQEAESTVPSM